MKVIVAKNISPRLARYGIAAPLKIGIKFSSAYVWNSCFNIFWITFYINNLHLNVNIHMFRVIPWRHMLESHSAPRAPHNTFNVTWTTMLRCDVTEWPSRNGGKWRTMNERWKWDLQTLVDNQACYSILCTHLVYLRTITLLRGWNIH